jgi:EpsD family peptidyl-prolyl cis-trans isomerase
MVGCQKDAPKAASQSLATVNGRDITVYQLNQELAQVSAPANPAQQEALQKQALEALIDRQVIVDAAIAAKLDRNPQVMHQFERAKTQILAQTYLQEQVAMVGQPSAAEVNEFYAKHPELFAKRKLFDMRQVIVAPASFDDAMKAAVDTAASVDDVAAWLDAHNGAYRREQGTKTTAELPQQIVSSLDMLSKGKPFVVREPNQVSVVSLKYVKDLPVTAEASSQEIGTFLSRKKYQDAVKAEVARLRAAAAIAYVQAKSAEAAPAQSEQADAALAAPAASGSGTDFNHAAVKLQ